MSRLSRRGFHGPCRRPRCSRRLQSLSAPWCSRRGTACPRAVNRRSANKRTSSRRDRKNIETSIVRRRQDCEHCQKKTWIRAQLSRVYYITPPTAVARTA
eukprot:6207208-Pleurochrysis_carterae.AAC.1